MITIKEFTVENNWLGVTWVETVDEIETPIHCESFSGHPEHIAMLEARASEFGTSLDEYTDVIKEVMEAFVMPTDEEIQAELKAHLVQEAQNYLASTDWYVVRFVDEGTEVPEDVKTKRAEAREFVRANSGGN